MSWECPTRQHTSCYSRCQVMCTPIYSCCMSVLSILLEMMKTLQKWLSIHSYGQSTRRQIIWKCEMYSWAFPCYPHWEGFPIAIYVAITWDGTMGSSDEKLSGCCHVWKGDLPTNVTVNIVLNSTLFPNLFTAGKIEWSSFFFLTCW